MVGLIGSWLVNFDYDFPYGFDSRVSPTSGSFHPGVVFAEIFLTRSKKVKKRSKVHSWLPQWCVSCFWDLPGHTDQCLASQARQWPLNAVGHCPYTTWFTWESLQFTLALPFQSTHLISPNLLGGATQVTKAKILWDLSQCFQFASPALKQPKGALINETRQFWRIFDLDLDQIWGDKRQISHSCGQCLPHSFKTQALRESKSPMVKVLKHF